MHVLFDHQIFSLQTYGGASRLFAELTKNLRLLQTDVNLAVSISENTHLVESGLKKPSALLSWNFPKKRQIVYQINDWQNRRQLKRGGFDVYHPTYYHPGLSRYVSNKPMVVTVLDMIHERFQDRFSEIASDRQVIDQKREIVGKATHVIAISESTKQDLIELYEMPASKISVIYLGSSFQAKTLVEKRSKPYLLFVGNRGSYKNFIPTLHAVRDILIQNHIQLVCAGGRNFSADEQQLIASLDLKDYVVQIPINDQQLASLYAGAIAFIFPSLYEGFGIPALEAFACRCPCILSHTSSLPEVGGDAAIYMDPGSQESIYKAVLTLVNNTELRNELIAKGAARLQQFSWRKNAEETLKVYQSL